MAKIWWEPFTGQSGPMDEVGRPPGHQRYWRARTLEHPRVLFVRVAGFTFVFHTAEQLRVCLDFYQRKLHPSSRAPVEVATGADGEVQRVPLERWYERLPLYLREEPKRQRVIAALEEATRQAEGGLCE